MRTSGSGKTRTLIELLCKKYGFYFTGLIKENPSSGDLSIMIDHLLPRLRDSLTHNDAYAMRYSKSFSDSFFDLNIFEEMILKFRTVPEHFLNDQIRILIHKILCIVNQKRLSIILDEAQELIDQFYNKFSSTTNKDKSRPLYSVIIRVFTILGICVIPSETGLTMKSVLNITGSHVMKGATWNHENLIVIKNRLDLTDRLRNFLSKFGFPFDDHQDIMQWFVGRVRFATTFVEEWLNNNFSIDALFKKFKEEYTDPVSNKSIMEGACESDIISLLERAVLKIWYNGINAIIIKEEIALELFEYGIALLHKSNFSKLQISISEPLVIESALRYFKKYKDISSYILDQMANMDFSPSNMGILWENLIPNAIMMLFQNEDLHDIFKKPLPYKNCKILEPSNGKLCVLAMHSIFDYNLSNFLENPVSSFFYPENTAGPDVITVVCPVDSDKKYLVLIQAKFREKNGDDVLLTTDPKKFYHTRPKKKGGKDKLLNGLIYKESYDKVTKLIDENYDGIFRIFISYPATMKLQEEKKVE
ncbi:4616_t:CDS:2, partial [Funneliformis geosporum]